MVDFRYHLVSIIAVFLALAVGIVLGAGPLDKPIDQAVKDRAATLAKDKAELRTQNDALSAQRDFDESLIKEAVPAVVGGRLEAVAVNVVAMPGTSGDLLGAARDAIEEAGGTVGGTVSLTSDWTDPTRSTDLDAALTATGQVSGLSGTDATSVAARAAAAVASSVVTTDTTAVGKADPASQAVLRTLRDAAFLRMGGKPWQRASLAVVLVPAPAQVASGSSRSPQQAAVDQATGVADVQVPQQLSKLAAGLVVAGPQHSADPAGAGPAGAVAVVRSGPLRTSVSTVDDLDMTAGRLALALALVAERDDQTGHYGNGAAADAPLPAIPGVTER
ncbi:copper transport outer membrane protein MctB [Motilibacter rhizosphaerae]|uniref:Copper transport outer membrane protein MctB n=1 Tax=Motilibacter rhizosphaerae TaxID=598652 RepID=A0A4Q7NB77_9ACTN|nr:copper transporter [Motilibacter rhizosphaerae]RZS80231.1 copper transport outer membrane protein MctB [Motilibacter rhizosphaerae]